MLETPQWKMVCEFHTDLIERWLSGKCPFWVLNNQFDIICTKKQRILDNKAMKIDMKKTP